jgi:hypothetical protein
MMANRWKTGALAWVALCGVSLAQTVPSTAPNNEQLVQSFRALLSNSSDTQAVIRAVADAVKQALQQGPMAPAQQAQWAAIATNPTLAFALSTNALETAAVKPPKTWADSITWKGDVRYRDEVRQDHAGNHADPNANVNYDRMRARIELDAQVNDNVKAVVRLGTDEYKTTAGGDPASNNQDLGNGDSKKGIYLDLGYIDWNLFGKSDSELHAIFGKMNNPFITMNDDTVWDPDVTPEGVAVKGTYDLNPVTLIGNAGYIVVNNLDSATTRNDQTDLYGIQGAVKYQFCPEVALTMGISDYYFNSIKGTPVSTVDVMGKAKSTTYYGNDVYVSGGSTNFSDGFDVVQPFASLDMLPKVCGLVVPVSVYAQGVDNVLAHSLNKGYMYGITLGKAKAPQTAEFGATYCKLERDSTLGMWTDSDRWGGGTDGEGYKLYVKYMILKNLSGQITYYNDKKGLDGANDGTGYNRYAFDLVASF